MKYLEYTIFILTLGLSMLAVNQVQAARLYLEPSEGEYGPGDSLEIDLKIDVLEACINTIDAEIEFPNDYLNIREFTTGDSIISIWLDKPANADFAKYSAEGKMHFAGGIPGGYCGKIPGDPGDSNIIGRIIFTIPTLIISDVERDQVEIKYSDKTKVLINDGQGTEDALLKQPAVFKIAANAMNKDFNWRFRLEADNIPPEPFVIELQQRNNMFEGRYYLIFSTVDKQTGVDHFEVLEIRPGEEIGVKPEPGLWEKLAGREKEAPNWKIAGMPYPLADQSLQSIIKVKAIDKAGNERIVEYIPPEITAPAKTKATEFWPWLILLIVAIMLVLGIIVYIVIKKIINRHNYEEE